MPVVRGKSPQIFVALWSFSLPNTSFPSEPQSVAKLQTYEGVLEGDRLRWAGEKPPDTDRPLRVHVTVLEEETPGEERGEQMAEALSKLAKSGAFGAIDDPSEWQREIRQDRPLPGREQ